ncbi:ribokinase [Halanaerobium sp. ST460_2HS_T2]|uniref:ribokinase n=1 Tax=Halanaerobium sp. ST460_2HS_T2 TaxID=2183914 RepID=UPI000DF38A50|nr:ribokinase [Halanaerobium sp. ST460_2HS_T2]RCW52251.1 ribokinase [Halanaerobium sp. ST460_2HS_T2]
MAKILIIGSMNMDLVVETERYPEEGETIIGGKFEQIPGGKGANQALAAAKLGDEIEFIGACGDDSFAPKLKSSLKAGGAVIDNIFEIKGVSTGVAVITVDKKGNNRIIVSPGANYQLGPDKIEKVKNKIIEAEIVLLQLEIPVATIEKIVEIASENNTQIILDPAPAQKLSDRILAKVDYLLPNEGELDLLLDESESKSRLEKIEELLGIGVKNIIVTEGDKGINYYSKGKNMHLDTLPVKAVDTTAAGDVFAGAFAASLMAENRLKEALEFAVQAAAYSVTKRGAQSSIPDKKELSQFLAERSK